MCDGKQSLHFVGFASSHQKIPQEFLEKRESVEIRNCQIKKSNRDSDKLEVLVKGATKVHPLPKKFDVLAMELQNTEVTPITQSSRLNSSIHNNQCGCQGCELCRTSHSWNSTETGSESQ